MLLLSNGSAETMSCVEGISEANVCETERGIRHKCGSSWTIDKISKWWMIFKYHSFNFLAAFFSFFLNKIWWKSANFFLFLLFLGPHLQHIEVHRSGVKSELQPQLRYSCWLRHSHSNAGSGPHLWPTPQLIAMQDL